MSLEYPYLKINTIDCNCPDIKYAVEIHFGPDSKQEAIIENFNLLPFLGRAIELINIHRIGENKKYEGKNE